MGKLYTCLKKIYPYLITLISNKALLKSTKPICHWTLQLIRSTKILFGICRVNETKIIGFIYYAVKIKCFIVISLLKQTLILVTPIDIGTKLLLGQSGR